MTAPISTPATDDQATKRIDRQRQAIGSVVIPAHNEQSVIADCLSPLETLAARGMIEVVVVCNGCTDATAEVARSFRGVRVVELPVGHKPSALRAGDKAVTALPRIYLDADVVLAAEATLAVLNRLADGGCDAPAGPLAARPPVRFDATGSNLLVRQFYGARSRIPAVLDSLWGAGAYALSASGRARFDEFPDLVADDLWVDHLFAPDEREIINCSPVTVRAPARTRDLLKVLRRTYRGKAGHHAEHPAIARETSGRTARDVGRLARTGPSGLVGASVYTGLVVAARILQRLAPTEAWERDESSRRTERGDERT
jgi:glycosyltransferase involved in cell wall biosynthesis